MNSEFKKTTDSKHRIPLKSFLNYGLWNMTQCRAGSTVPLKVMTTLVGDGTDVKITAQGSDYGKIETLKGKLIGNTFIGELELPKDLKNGETLTFSIEVPSLGLKGTSNNALALTTPVIRSLKWSKQQIDLLETVTLTAEFEKIEPGCRAMVSIYRLGEGGNNDVAKRFPVYIENQKMEVTWRYDCELNLNSVLNVKQCKQLGVAFKPIQYFFTLAIDGVIFGKNQESGLLTFKRTLDFRVKNALGDVMPNTPYELELADGSIVKGITDSQGAAVQKSVFPGPVKIGPNQILETKQELAKKQELLSKNASTMLAEAEALVKDASTKAKEALAAAQATQAQITQDIIDTANKKIQQAQQAKEKAQAKVNDLKDAAEKALQEKADKLQEKLTEAKGTIQEAEKKVEAARTETIAAIEKVRKEVKNVYEKTQTTIQSTAQTIQKSVDKTVMQAQAAAQIAMAKAQQSSKNVESAVLQKIYTAQKQFEGMAQKAATDLTNLSQNAEKLFQDYTQKAGNDFEVNAKKAGDEFESKARSAAQQFEVTAKNGITQFQNKALQISQQLQSQGQQISNQILVAANQGVHAFESATSSTARHLLAQAAQLGQQILAVAKKAGEQIETTVARTTQPTGSGVQSSGSSGAQGSTLNGQQQSQSATDKKSMSQSSSPMDQSIQKSSSQQENETVQKEQSAGLQNNSVQPAQSEPNQQHQPPKRGWNDQVGTIEKDIKRESEKLPPGQNGTSKPSVKNPFDQIQDSLKKNI